MPDSAAAGLPRGGAIPPPAVLQWGDVRYVRVPDGCAQPCVFWGSLAAWVRPRSPRSPPCRANGAPDVAGLTRLVVCAERAPSGDGTTV